MGGGPAYMGGGPAYMGGPPHTSAGARRNSSRQLMPGSRPLPPGPGRTSQQEAYTAYAMMDGGAAGGVVRSSAPPARARRVRRASVSDITDYYTHVGQAGAGGMAGDPAALGGFAPSPTLAGRGLKPPPSPAPAMAASRLPHSLSQPQYFIQFAQNSLQPPSTATGSAIPSPGAATTSPMQSPGAATAERSPRARGDPSSPDGQGHAGMQAAHAAGGATAAATAPRLSVDRGTPEGRGRRKSSAFG